MRLFFPAMGRLFLTVWLNLQPNQTQQAYEYNADYHCRFIIIYQRWRIGDQNVFIERFIRQNEEQREKLKREGII